MIFIQSSISLRYFLHKRKNYASHFLCQLIKKYISISFHLNNNIFLSIFDLRLTEFPSYFVMNRSIILCKTQWYVHRMLNTFMIQACSALDYSYKCFMFIEFCIVITLFFQNKCTPNFASPLAEINRLSEFVLNIVIYFLNPRF